MRALVGAANKSGTYFVFDRNTGETVWTTVIGYGAVGGGMLWEASIGDGKVYTSSNNRYPGGSLPEQFPINVKKLDASTGEFDLGSGWSQPGTQPAVGASAGFLSSDVYLVGSLDGTVQAYDDADGSVVASLKAPAGVGSALVVDDETLLFGYGVPQAFGGAGTGHGVVAYRPAG
jgi:polyvinyl alcohol dehydrogenase (cytochrome)